MNAAAFFGQEDRRRLVLRALAVLLLVYCLRLLANTKADVDLWGYLAFGRLFWQTGAFPYQDIFTYVPTHPVWVYHEWLTGVIYYPLYTGLGPWSLQVLKFSVALATLGLVYLSARLQGADVWGALGGIFMISGFLITFYSPVRAQVFTYFFFALTVYLLEKCRLRQAWGGLGWLVPVQVVWCNLHGGFLAGLGLMAIYGVGALISRQRSWPYFLALAAAGLATFLNPYGYDYWRYLAVAVTMPRPEISEWHSTFATLFNEYYQINSLFFLFMVYIALTLLWLTRFREVTPLLALAVTLIMGLRHFRHQAFFLLLCGVFLAAPLSAYLPRWRLHPWWEKCRQLDYRLPLAFYLLLLGFCVGQVIYFRPWQLNTPPAADYPDLKVNYPVGALAYIRQHGLQGRLATEFPWGEYLLWELYPTCRVALDGRYETVYPEKVVRPFMDFIFARAGWQRFLEEYPPDMILISTKSELPQRLQEDGRWRQVYADAGSVLFVRQPGPEQVATTCQEGGR